MSEHLDVLVVGAGLSGIDAARHLAVGRPGTSFAVLEGRDALGGTWDAFRFPGVRSDSDMATLGYRWRPWTGRRAVADGAAVLEYLHEAVRAEGLTERVRLGHRVTSASWSSAQARWSVTGTAAGQPFSMTCGFLWMCTGYFRYDRGWTPPLPGIEAFAGPVVHPQQWPADLDVSGRRVLVLGSGSTAVTLVPALARVAAHVTMLQRSPGYVLSVPAVDVLAVRLRRRVGDRLAHRVVRARNVARTSLLLAASRRVPGLVRRLVRRAALRQLPDGYDLPEPRYDPWDQRFCLVPDGDLFRAVSGGRASVVTGVVETFTAWGARLESGAEVAADVVVTATGLDLLVLGGTRLVVDGVEVRPADAVLYKGAMLGGVPNLALTIGYAHASWTLKADLVSEWVVRLLAHLAEHGHHVVVPPAPPVGTQRRPVIDLDAGYVRRAADRLPQVGYRSPWDVGSAFLRDRRVLRRGRVDDGLLRFR